MVSVAKAMKKKKPKTKLSNALPALASRSGELIAPDKMRRAIKRVGKSGPKKKRDPKFRGIV